MTILGFSFDPLGAVAAFNIGLAWMIIILGRRYLNGEFTRNGYVEPEPEIDMDLFEAEMQMEAAALEYRLADERRAEMVARAS